MHLLTSFFIAIFSFSLMAADTHAVVFQAKSFDELVTNAEQVFIGTAVQAVSRRAASGAIFTDYSFLDVEIVKGEVPSAGPLITFLGGTIGDESMQVSGAPTFRMGVRYVVFVAGNGSVAFPAVGGAQGIFEVRTDTATGSRTVHDYGGRALLQAAKGSSGAGVPGSSPFGVSRAELPASGALRLEDFVGAIRNRLGR